MTTQELFSTRIDLPVDAREVVIDLCNQQLADIIDLHSHTKHAHWNVKGPQFYQLHELYDELADKLRHFADEIAERATQLGGMAHGTVRMAAKATRLPDYPLEAVDSLDTVRALADRYGQAAASTREAIEKAEHQDDASTADLFTEVSRGLDKALWFLEAHLQG